MQELYGIDVSPDLISAVTDAVLDEIAAWQIRPLESVYPIVRRANDSPDRLPSRLTRRRSSSEDAR